MSRGLGFACLLHWDEFEKYPVICKQAQTLVTRVLDRDRRLRPMPAFQQKDLVASQQLSKLRSFQAAASPVVKDAHQTRARFDDSVSSAHLQQAPEET
jgi:hypothetical protein